MRTLTLIYSFFLVTSAKLSSQGCSKYYFSYGREVTKIPNYNYGQEGKVIWSNGLVVKKFSGQYCYLVLRTCTTIRPK